MIYVRKARQEDLDEIAELYDAVTAYLEAHINYPQWKNGIYPARMDGEEGLEKDCLYVAEMDGRIVGTAMYEKKQDKVYHTVKWQKETNPDKVYVIHTLAVHPDYSGKGIGKAILTHAANNGRENGIEAIRLDVYETNLPAMKLYEACGFQYIDTIDMGLEELYGLKWFKVYEKLL